MGYPQPQADDAVVGGENFFRFTSELSSPGDIYESTQSGYAFAVGPDSDLARIAVAYFDEQQATKMSQVVLSPERAFVGFLPSRNDAGYVPSQRPGRILFYSADFYNPDYKPVGISVVNDTKVIIAPVLDLIQYFSPPDSVTPMRSDRVFNFQKFTKGAVPASSVYLCVPFYGRAYAFLDFTNRDGAAVTLEVRGVNLTTTTVAVNENQEKQLLAPTAIADNANQQVFVRSATSGEYDYLVFKMTPTAITAILSADFKLVMSDVTK